MTGVWLISDDKKKQLIVKFNEEMSGMERMAYLRCIGQSLMTMAATEDAKEGGESGFGNLMDMMQLREWHKEDEETIRNGISSNVFPCAMPVILISFFPFAEIRIKSSS